MSPEIHLLRNYNPNQMHAADEVFRKSFELQSLPPSSNDQCCGFEKILLLSVDVVLHPAPSAIKEIM